jgi:hypothetical protein
VSKRQFWSHDGVCVFGWNTTSRFLVVLTFGHALGGGGSSGLLGEEDGVNVGKDTSSGNGHSSQELVEFLVILDGKGNVTWYDAALLVITGGIAGKFQNLSAEVFEDRSEVDGCASTHAGGILSLSQIPSNTTHGELQTRLGRRCRALLLAASSFSFS